MNQEETRKAIAFEEKCEAEHGRYFCRSCADNGKIKGAEERFVGGIYAGMYCTPCFKAAGYDENWTYDYLDAGEHLEPEEY